jgi:hypothetical protein
MDINLEKIAEQIKLELHDKHMMYIDGEDSVTHRWCKKIIWRVLNEHLGKTQDSSLPSKIVILSRTEANKEANEILNRNLEDEEWEKIVKEIHQVSDYFEEPYIQMTDIICEMNNTCEECGGEGSFDRSTFPDYIVCESCGGTGKTG